MGSYYMCYNQFRSGRRHTLAFTYIRESLSRDFSDLCTWDAGAGREGDAGARTRAVRAIVSWSVERSGRDLREGEHRRSIHDERCDVGKSVKHSGDGERVGNVLWLFLCAGE